ncbi:DUF3618 domain-containing protein [Streptomyces bluensis]|uniref:DUF3618 domain-containing protein n=1 Tax=Streptomyces bluensis TaxID=33897 RepID=UPI001066DF29
MTSTSGGSAGSIGPAGSRGMPQPPRSAGAKGPDELRQQIAMTRHQLGDTVEELVAKTDVKARARAQVADLKGSASHAAHSVRERVPRVTRAVVIGGVGVAAAAVGAVTWRQREASRAVMWGRRRRAVMWGRRRSSSASALRRDVARRIQRIRRS